jgi:hypothetical protein
MTRSQATPVAAILWTLSFALILSGAWAFGGVTPAELAQHTVQSIRDTWSVLVSWAVAAVDLVA